MTNALVLGSLSAVAQHGGQSIAESFIDVDAIIIVDVSGSMGAHDSRGGKSRYNVAIEELAALQANMPGKLAIIAFSNDAQFVPGGEPAFFGGGTNLAGALTFAKTCDLPGIQMVVISDGEPNDRDAALSAARNIQASISTVYVGPEGGRGRDFLERLATANKGTFGQAARVISLAETVRPMLGAG